MRIPVLVESVSGNGFRARGGEPLALSAQGTTRDEAIASLKRMIADRLAVGAELISLDVESRGPSLAPAPGWSEDDPLLDEWQEGRRVLSTPRRGRSSPLMSLYVLDTDTLTLAQRGHRHVSRRIQSMDPPHLVITVISVEEQLSGWYTLLWRTNDPAKLERVYRRLAENVTYFSRSSILPFTKAAIERCAHLRAPKLNVGKMDLAIAAIVLEHGGILVTRNTRDFRRVANLALEDWSLPVP